MTVWNLIGANLRQYAIMLSVSCVGIGLLYFTELPAVALPIGAFVAGVLLRDVGWFRQQIIGWPMTCAIIDWQRVEQLVTSDDSVPARDHQSNPSLDS